MADIHARLDRAREVANDLAGNATARIAEGAEKARDTAGTAYADARDRTQNAAARVNRIVHEHPITVVAGAVAAGAVVAWMFPKSRAAMKSLPGLIATAGASVAEAALAARAAATEGAHNLAESAQRLKDNAGEALHSARAGEALHRARASEALHSARESLADTASAVQDRVIAADIPARASRLADEALALVVDKAEAFTEALKTRLPKR